VSTTTDTAPRPATGAPAASRLLLRVAFLIFTITVAIGILNGIDLVDFGRDTLLTHVHAGTLGWITLGVVGAGIWMFRDVAGRTPDPRTEQRLAVVVIITTLLYVGAFWLGQYDLRPVAGTLMLVAIVYAAAWHWQRREGIRDDIPRLGMMLAFVSLVIGAVFGVLLGLATAGRADWLPSEFAEAHPPTMVIGYLIMAALAIVEWRIAPSGPDGPSARSGRWQVWLVFTAGVVLLVGLILESQPLLILSQPLEIAGIVIFLVRLGRRLVGVRWGDPVGGRAYTASVVFLLANVVLLLSLVARYADNPDAIPMNHILALDHMMFLGVMTNAIIALALAAAPERDPLPAMDDTVYWGLNLGLVFFAVGLLADVSVLKRIGTPVLGLALLLAIGVHSVRLAQREPTT
jgi:hypothetical protein